MPRTIALGLAALLLPAACSVTGSLGAPCERDPDCDEGLTCDLHAVGGSCQHAHGHDEPMMRDCSTEPRADAFAIGLQRIGAWATVEFVEASPAPPSRGDNAWTVRVLDQAGVPRDDLEIVVDPFMPDHGHGSTIRCEVEAGVEPGTYVLSPVNMFMPGVWEVTLEIAADGAPPDSVMFTFCVDP